MSSNKSSRAVAAIVIAICVIVLIVLALLLQANFRGITQPKLGVPFVSVASNWAGYEVASNFLIPKATVQSVSGSWTVPAVQSSSQNSYSSVWIGVGGQFDATLIQVGTEQDFTGGDANYYAWYELLPNTEVTITSVQVSPGDQIQASITLTDAAQNVWTITLQDLSTHAQYQGNLTYNSTRLTAEWIVERPQLNGALANLADFGSVAFTNCQAELSGQTGAITAFTYEEVYMGNVVQNGHSVQLVSASNPKDGGTAFTVNYAAI